MLQWKTLVNAGLQPFINSVPFAHQLHHLQWGFCRLPSFLTWCFSSHEGYCLKASQITPCKSKAHHWLFSKNFFLKFYLSAYWWYFLCTSAPILPLYIHFPSLPWLYIVLYDRLNRNKTAVKEKQESLVEKE